ncbi:hypothetical protein FHN55_16600 [Streptomyces sp. NP160]|uniref:ApeA N-terminal domain 1-containing protein n=1 Tax=Streptomyces sp. NP160 TaxID=2586637 RepID=UPI00111B5BF2|nr:hypothetical protein [Streptomyces sp. NP160]TNM61933.1 hypothetical protein FHN55_16600 [Streptomyces sp. NP160]
MEAPREPPDEYAGFWWFPSEAKQAWGTLALDERGTARLSLLAPLADDERHHRAVSVAPRHIFGSTVRGPVSIIDATYAGGQSGSGHTVERWRAGEVVIGHHVTPGTTFTTLVVESEALAVWNTRTWMESEQTDGASVTRVPLPILCDGHPFSRGRISLHSSFQEHWSHLRVSYERHCKLVVEYDSPTAYEVCLDDAAHLRTLLELLFERHITVDHVRLGLPEQPPWEARSQVKGWVTRTSGEETRPPPRLALVDALLDFDAFGGDAGPARWMELSKPLRYLAGRVATHHDRQQRYLEDTAMTAYACLEAMGKLLVVGEKTYRGRTLELLRRLPGFESVVLWTDVETWIAAVVADRNSLGHGDFRHEAAGSDWQLTADLSSSAHLLATFSLLQAAHVPQEAMDMALSSQPVLRWHEHLRRRGALTGP